MGQKLMRLSESWSVIDAKTFVLKLKEKTGLVLPALAKPSASPLFVMPKRVAETDPNKQISEFIGSGPFVFKTDEWKPGDKAVYVKFDKYKPRPEPPSGLAGGKVVKVDRVEWRAISDQQQAVNALLAGEIDFIEQPPHDLHALLKADANIKMWTLNPLGSLYFFRPNHLNKPFDDPKIRSASLVCAQPGGLPEGGDRRSEHYKVCRSHVHLRHAAASRPRAWTGCSPPTSTRRRALLKEAGYDGTPIVLMHSTDLHVLANVAPVAKQLMEKAGFKVDMQSMDMQTHGGPPRQARSADKGGWHAFITSPTSLDGLDPDHGQHPQRRLREGLARLAVRRGDGEAARPVRARDRSGEAEGTRRRHPGALDRDHHAHQSRPIPDRVGRTQERHRPHRRRPHRVLERREEVTAGRRSASVALRKVERSPVRQSAKGRADPLGRSVARSIQTRLCLGTHTVRAR